MSKQPKTPKAKAPDGGTLKHLRGFLASGTYAFDVRIDGKRICAEVTPDEYFMIEGWEGSKTLVIVAPEADGYARHLFINGKHYRRFEQNTDACAAFHTLAACYHQEQANGWRLLASAPSADAPAVGGEVAV